jgi:hypothetical protein
MTNSNEHKHNLMIKCPLETNIIIMIKYHQVGLMYKIKDMMLMMDQFNENFTIVMIILSLFFFTEIFHFLSYSIITILI